MNPDEITVRRCDGCGEQTSSATRYLDENGDVEAKYCPGCELMRRNNDIEIADHEQYKLARNIEEIGGVLP